MPPPTDGTTMPHFQLHTLHLVDLQYSSLWHSLLFKGHMMLTKYKKVRKAKMAFQYFVSRHFESTECHVPYQYRTAHIMAPAQCI